MARAVVRFAGKVVHSLRPDLGENAVLAAARFCLELEKLNAAYPEQRLYEDAVARATVAPTRMQGGKLSNILPGQCEVTVSRRLAPGESRETFQGELDRLLDGCRATCELFGDGLNRTAVYPCAVMHERLSGDLDRLNQQDYN